MDTQKGRKKCTLRQRMVTLGMSEEEKKQQIKEKRKEYRRLKRQERTEQEKEFERKRMRERMRIKRSQQTEEEKDIERRRNREAMQVRRSHQTEEDKELERIKNREAMQVKRQKLQVIEEIVDLTSDTDEFQYDTCDEETTLAVQDCYCEDTFMDTFSNEVALQCISEFEKSLQKTLLQRGEVGFVEGQEVHQACICVVCDRFIIGREQIHWIGIHSLLFHENILTSEYHYGTDINPILKGQYTLDDERISHMLLSPRARRNKDADTFMCCTECKTALDGEKKRKRNTPPKFAISNGFAIGYLPPTVSQGITPVVNNLVAPVRAFNYFLTFNGGREQKITGNFTFFSQNVSENIGALRFTAEINNASCVYVMLQGSFTTVQLELIRRQGIYNVETFQRVYKFLHTNNPHYSGLPHIENVPTPIVQEIREDDRNTSEQLLNNENKEETITWKYWFPNVEEPSTINGTHESQSEFAKAILTGETPTLIYHPSDILLNATLSQLCPTVFPFGTGDINVVRKPQVSEIECFKHYLKLSLPQLSEGQIVLLIHHMYQRKISFLTGITKFNRSSNGMSMGTMMSDITSEEIDEMITQMKNQSASSYYAHELNSSEKVNRLLQNIRTCCMPIGYTNEAAADARNNMFALWTSFGPPSLLFTLSPCDECSFNMHLFATSEAVELPHIDKCHLIMSSNLTLRKTLRVKYPGSAAREFDNIFQLVLFHILGWERPGNIGIFGKLQAFSAGIEEQGRTSLHAHIILWLYKFQLLQKNLFSSDENERIEAQQKLKEYMSTVLSTSFDISDIHFKESMAHPVDGKGQTTCTGNMEGVSKQTLRNMRHRQHLKEEKGVILKCNKCSNSHDTAEFINKVISYLLPDAKLEYPSYPIDLLKFPLTTEQMDLLALRFRFDMINIPKSAVKLRKVLQLIMLLYFNTHDWKHRKSCFKKGLECRFHLPQQPNNETTITYGTDDVNGLVNGDHSAGSSMWYFVNGTHQKVCSYEIAPKRTSCDVFVNSHNPILANVIGYNNNVCMGSINTLYYCTLYSSKSTQEEETYPYKKALEAVSKRIKNCQQQGTEDNLSCNQIGLRRLLSGINAHISSCVVSATMAWYLVVHGSRFKYSHEFKPLLVTQLEAWYNSEEISHRIRYKRKRGENTQPADNTQLQEDHNEVWFDSEVNNYLFRPDHIDFNNLSIWEFHCKYDMTVVKPEKVILGGGQHDEDKKYWRFQKDHPGYIYCCLKKRPNTSKCVPKLYFKTKFPDIASLQIDINEPTVICDHTKEVRELYALKALLLFMPFRKRSDLVGNHSNLWLMLTSQRNNLQSTTISKPHLYRKTEDILQNIQNMYNVKKVLPSQDTLLACTNAADECPNYTTGSDAVQHDEEIECEDQTTAYIEAIMNDINETFQSVSAFNNQMSLRQLSQLYQLRPSLMPITPTDTSIFSYSQQQHVINIDQHIHSINGTSHLPSSSVTRSHALITVVTKCLDVQNIDTSVQVFRNEARVHDLEFDLSSLDTFATQNNLDMKQHLAFKSICASFILTYVDDPDFNCTHEQILHLKQLLYKQGASSQLLMCVTGPGGSGKSHVIKCCRMYCKMFCTAIEKHFDFSVFPITATSNSAASLLKGKTIHSAALLNHRRIAREYSSTVDWTATKILIIDEISMAGIDLFEKLDKNLRILTGKRGSLYGGLHIVSMGDFMQLSPVGCPPIYKRNDDFHWHGCLNAAVFLDQANHRFIKDPVWGDMLRRIQVGEPTSDDLERINERLITLCQTPSDIDCAETRLVYGCFSNKRRNEITNAFFLDYVLKNNPEFHSNVDPTNTALLLKGAITRENKDLGVDFHKLIWALCGDNNLDSEGKKVDPCLRLIHGCPLMINSNTEKDRNIAKGTVGNYIGVKWKNGCHPHIEDFHGYKVHAAHIHEIECLLMALEGEKDIIEIKPESVHINITYENFGKKISMSKCNICQIPVNLSLATTGHKLQGMTKDILVLAEISTRTPNWLYVVLSRVTTLKGLYLTEPLTKNMFKPISRELRQELDFLHSLEQKLIQQCDNHYIEQHV